ncbi:MAG: phytoene/squalene synthase family protein [Candidatus Micrarchaeota archaeon]
MNDTGFPKVDFKYAENSIKAGSKTFYFATSFTSKERRNSIHAIYSFCRHTDNLVDDNEGNPKLQLLLITDWRKRLLEAYKKGHSTDPILNPFVYVMKKNRIPIRYALELINGVSMDITKKEYKNFRELRKYCFRVASVVGLMLTYVLGIENIKKFKKYATKLGIAMQLTNILRDVGEDARMGRVYFPKDELAKFGLVIQDILSLRKTSNVIKFLKFQVARARKYYEEAITGLSLIQRDGRVMVELSLSLYREILKVIEENEYEVYTKRAYVHIFRKVLIYFKIVLFGYAQPTLVPSNDV